MSETTISAAIKAAIKKEFPQIQFTRLQCGRARGLRGRGIIYLADPGWPDYIGYLPDGRFFGLEIKDPKGTTAKERAIVQTARKLHINNAGGFAITVTSVEEALKLIREEMSGLE